MTSHLAPRAESIPGPDALSAAETGPGADAAAPPLQLYLHVPFCEKKCHYCDFASWELPAVQQRRWTETVLRELEAKAGEARGRKVDTVFFGGGTPSLLASEFLRQVVEAMGKHYDLSAVREMSLECNPSSLNREKLDLYHALGFGRVSLGIQSFHAHELALLGRVHTVETAARALETMASDGRFQFSGDLIFGVPGQTRESFLESLGRLVGFGPDHVSFYGLTIEDGTEFARRRDAGLLSLPEDGSYNRMYQDGAELLERAGYLRYEVSNFSRPGQTCRHNQGYWNGAEYLAFGPGAHGFFAGRRMVSPRDFEGYIAWGAAGFPEDACVVEVLGAEERLSEAVLLGLRQAAGVDLEALRRGFGFTVGEDVLGKWRAVGMLEQEGALPGRKGALPGPEGATIRLVGDGWLFLDEIGADLLARGKWLRG